MSTAAVYWQIEQASLSTLTEGFLIAGFIVLGLICCLTFYQAFSLQSTYMGKDELDEAQQEQLDEVATSISLAGWVTAVGFFHYLCLYEGFGHVILTNGESFSWITYIEFIITTPIILMNLASLIHAPGSVTTQLVLFDLLMIIAGFIASVSTQVGWRYTWYVISFIFFIGIFKILFTQNALMDVVLGDEFKSISVLYRRIMVLTVITWSIYPILFIFGPNGNVVQGGSITEVTTVLDMFSKGLSGLLFSFAKRSLNKAQDEIHGVGEGEEGGSSCFGLCHEEPKKKAPAAMDQMQMMQMIQMVLAQQMQPQMQVQQPQMASSDSNAAMQMQLQQSPSQMLTPRSATTAVMQHMGNMGMMSPQMMMNANAMGSPMQMGGGAVPMTSVQAQY